MASFPASSAAPTLAELLLGCRRHEPAAQWALYQRFALPMLTVAQRYAPTRADAEDALQDAFVKIFQKLDEQRDPAAFAGWVRRIVISTAITAWHKRRVRRVDFDLDDAHHVPTPEASALDQLAVEEVLTIIDQLPSGSRLVLLLATIEGYSHQEIGELLGIAESASRMQLTRARQRLTELVARANRERNPAPASRQGAPPAVSIPPFHPLTTLLFQ